MRFFLLVTIICGYFASDINQCRAGLFDTVGEKIADAKASLKAKKNTRAKNKAEAKVKKDKRKQAKLDAQEKEAKAKLARHQQKERIAALKVKKKDGLLKKAGKGVWKGTKAVGNATWKGTKAVGRGVKNTGAWVMRDDSYNNRGMVGAAGMMGNRGYGGMGMMGAAGMMNNRGTMGAAGMMPVGASNSGNGMMQMMMMQQMMSGSGARTAPSIAQSPLIIKTASPPQGRIAQAYGPHTTGQPLSPPQGRIAQAYGPYTTGQPLSPPQGRIAQAYGPHTTGQPPLTIPSHTTTVNARFSMTSPMVASKTGSMKYAQNSKQLKSNYQKIQQLLQQQKAMHHEIKIIRRYIEKRRKRIHKIEQRLNHQ